MIFFLKTRTELKIIFMSVSLIYYKICWVMNFKIVLALKLENIHLNAENS